MYGILQIVKKNPSVLRIVFIQQKNIFKLNVAFQCYFAAGIYSRHKFFDIKERGTNKGIICKRIFISHHSIRRIL